MDESAKVKKHIKVLLLGDQSVGKTSLRSQLVYKVFSYAYKSTVGADYLTSAIDVSDERIILQIWDTAGQERFNSITKAFYRGTDVAILCYDITRADSFYHIENWLEQFSANCNVTRPSILIVGNKCDKDPLRQVSLRQSKEFVSLSCEHMIRDIDKDVIEVSAKDHTQVEELFRRVAEIGSMRKEHQMMEFDTVDVDIVPRGSRCC